MKALADHIQALKEEAKDHSLVEVIALKVFEDALAKVEEERDEVEQDARKKEEELSNSSKDLETAIKEAGSLEKAIDRDAAKLHQLGLNSRLAAILSAYASFQRKERGQVSTLSAAAAKAASEYLEAAHSVEDAQRLAGIGEDARERQFEEVQDEAERMEDHAQDLKDEGNDAIEDKYNQVEQLVDHRMDVFKDAWNS
eukprot:1454964-Amphidinium_carterae.1